MANVRSLMRRWVLRDIGNKSQEKRRRAAEEVQGLAKRLFDERDHDNISALIDLMSTEFTCSSDPDCRKGGLLALSAIVLGLTPWVVWHLKPIVLSVLNSFVDQDSKVRYHACEALYNIAKIVRGDLLVHFDKVFDAICKLSADSDAEVQTAASTLNRLVQEIATEGYEFSIEEFVQLLKERMNVLSPYVRQFLLGWITILNSSPNFDLLRFLPDLIHALFNMLCDSTHEVRHNALVTLSEFLEEIKNSTDADFGRMVEILVQKTGSPCVLTRLTAITWLNVFLKNGGAQLVPYYADILGAILPCISDKDEKTRLVSRATNEVLCEVNALQVAGFHIGAILSVARRQLSSEFEATRIEALHWMSILLAKHHDEVIALLKNSFDSLMEALADPSDEVVLLALDLHACLASDVLHFHQFFVFLVYTFRDNNLLLENKGTLIVRRLCVLFDAKKVYCELSAILEREDNLDCASIMIQALNSILLTSSELAALRTILKQSLVDSSAKDLFVSLYSSWCHSPVATISLCLLAQAYHHASCVIQSLGEEDINAKLLVQLDKLIRLLETPIFAYLRLQLLEPGRYVELSKSLYGLWMLLPQESTAFRLLQTRLASVPPYFQILEMTEDESKGQEGGNPDNGIDFVAMLQQFEHTKIRHHRRARSRLQQSHASSSSMLPKEIQGPEESNQPSPVSIQG